MDSVGEWMKSWGICIVDRHGHVKGLTPMGRGKAIPWSCWCCWQSMQKLATPTPPLLPPNCNRRLYYRDFPLRLANSSCCAVHNKRTEFSGCRVGSLCQSKLQLTDSSFYGCVSVISLFLHHPRQAMQDAQGSAFQTAVPWACKALRLQSSPFFLSFFSFRISHNVLW